MSRRLILATIVLAAACVLPVAGTRQKLGFSVTDSGHALSSIVEGEDIAITVYAPQNPTANNNHLVQQRGKLRLRGEPTDVARASSWSPEVVEVLGVDGSQVRLRGLKAGIAELEVATATWSDQITLRVEPVLGAEFLHDNKQLRPRDFVLVAGGLMSFDVRRWGESGPVMGYGLLAFVNVEPSTAGKLARDPAAVQELKLKIGAPGSLTLRPLVGEPLTLEVVQLPQDLVFELQLVPEAKPEGGFFVLSTAEVADGPTLLGWESLMTLSSTTPEVCTVERRVGPAALVRTLQSGSCKVAATLGPRTSQVSVEVLLEPAPAK